MRTVLLAFLLALALAVPGAAAPQAAVAVPFVGCPFDGQQGPNPAPTGQPRQLALDPATAARLAYYDAGIERGVLAPRGWHCLGLSGSDGTVLFVSPQPLDAERLIDGGALPGPVVILRGIEGGTSGRFEAARIAARVFPSERAFVKGVIDEGIEPAESFPQGPFVHDRMTRLDAHIVEYETPGGEQGLGTTTRWLQPEAEPVRGAVVLGGDLPHEPEIEVLMIRLDAADAALVPVIVHNLERGEADEPPRDRP